MSFRTNRRTGGIFRLRDEPDPISKPPKGMKEYTILLDLHGKPGEEFDPKTSDQYEREYIFAKNQEDAEKYARENYSWAIKDFDSGRSIVEEGHNEFIEDYDD